MGGGVGGVKEGEREREAGMEGKRPHRQTVNTIGSKMGLSSDSFRSAVSCCIETAGVIFTV